MQRLGAEEFMAQTLDHLQDLDSELRERLVQIASHSPAARVRELEEAFQEAARG